MTDEDCTALKSAMDEGYLVFFDDSNGLAVQVIRMMKLSPWESFNCSDETAMFAVYKDGEIGNLKIENINNFKIYKRIYMEQIRHHPDLGGFK